MASKKSIMAVIRTARPSYRNNSDKIAFSVHASFLASGYGLIATGGPAFSEDAFYSPSTDEVGFDHWNDFEDVYAFLYTNPEIDGKKVLAKCLVMGDRFLLHALAYDDPDLVIHFEISIGDFVGEEGGANVSAQFKNLDKLVKDLNDEIFSKLDASDSESSSANQPRGFCADGGVQLGPNYRGVLPLYHSRGRSLQLVVARYDPYGSPGLDPNLYARYSYFDGIARNAIHFPICHVCGALFYWVVGIV